MIFLLLFLVGAAVLALVLLSRSHRVMNVLSLAHATAYVGIVAYALARLPLPLHADGSDYLFLDHLGAYEILVASVVFFLAALYLEGYIESLIRAEELPKRNLRLFYVAMNLLLIATAFSFASDNLAVFWIFLELTTLFSAVLVVTLNAKENIDVALKYIFIASTSMLFSFIGIILLFFLSAQATGTGTLEWSALMLHAATFSPALLLVSFLFILIGFAAKSGIAPFHTWLPHTHAKAPSAVSVVLSGAVVNMGIYGILRVFAIVHQTSALTAASWFLIGFGIFSVAVASLSMLRQRNTKRIIAFSSIEHMGVILVGIGIATRTSVFWSLAYVLAHSLAKSLLFFSAGIINRQYESNEAEDVRDIFRLQPLASLGLIVGSLTIVGMPPFLLFLPKLFIIIELGKVSLLLFFLLMLFLLIAVVAFGAFMMRLFSAVPEAGKQERIPRFPVPAKMSLTLAILITLVLALGLWFPSYVQHVIDAIVTELRF